MVDLGTCAITDCAVINRIKSVPEQRYKAVQWFIMPVSAGKG
jgi:hypothetical protein